MRSTHTFHAAAATAGLVGLLLLPAAASAQGGGAGSWTVRGFGAWLETSAETHRTHSVDPLPPVGESRFVLGDGDGVGLALEYRITRRIGVEALAILADVEGELRVVFTDPPIPEQVVRQDVDSDLYGLGLSFHLTPGRRIDVYLGPLLAIVRYGDFLTFVDCGDFACAFEASYSDDTALGATLGADVALGSSRRWAVSAAVRQLWSTADPDFGQDMELNPLIASAGVAYRWGGR